MDYECNYLQALEGVTDGSHSAVLHTGFHLMHWTPEQISRAALGSALELAEPEESEDTPYGFRRASTRPDPSDPTRGQVKL